MLPQMRLQQPDLRWNPAPSAQNPPNDHLFHAIQYADEARFFEHMEKAISNGASIHALNRRGETVLDIAIERNSTAIVQHLLARGARLPVVGADGVDLVMKAAKNGNAAMIALLIDLGDLLPDEQSASGMTPLHYAIHAGSVSSVKALLGRDAGTGKSTYPMSIATLDTVLDELSSEPGGTMEQLAGKNISPLMLAVALGHGEIAAMLLRHGADPTAGDPSPLSLAVSGDDKQMLELLLKAPAARDDSYRPTLAALLGSAIRAGRPVECLRPLATALDTRDSTNEVSEELSGLLEIAIGNGHLQATALLLACGAAPEVPDDPDKSVWTLASEHEHDQEFLNTLTVCHADHLKKREVSGEPAVLASLSQLAQHTVSLASNGLFVSLISPLSGELTRIRNRSAELSVAQTAVETAFLLQKSTSLKKHAADSSSIDEDSENNTDTSWLALVPSEMTDQASWLRTEAGKRMDALDDTLENLMSPQYFLNCTRSRSENASLEATMAGDLRDNLGVPEPLATLITQAWIDATHIAPAPEDWPGGFSSTVAFTTALASRLLANALGSLAPEPGTLLAHCVAKLDAALAPSGHPLTRFVASPAQFLRALENRTNLRAPDTDALANALCVQLGLDLQHCKRLASAWAVAIDNAARQPGHISLADRQRLIDARFARELDTILREQREHVGSDNLPVTAEEFDRMLGWCAERSAPPANADAAVNAASASVAPAAALVSRKRAATEDLSVEPQKQKPRFS